ncbi:efflux RND transporter periplasmic adaptor subunit [Pelagibius sp.]|uniref:efflux RND transporter periplasmic adaptor subunit n=1 Tax=Pelagibius sp. TaxID=1931238 RepID=UPI0026358C82|nr:efflux RND transporter periplasmic adaptor subunit [Pelagibius sp.]
MKRLLPACLTVLALAACGESNTYVEPPPPKVKVAAPLVQSITDYLYFTGTTQAAAVVDVRARVPGELVKMTFGPGTDVQAGDPLFMIDQREYIADVEIAKAQLESAKALKIEADRALERAETLIQRGNISQARLDEAEAGARSATAEVSVKQAALRQAELDLEYTDIRAPITGRIGRNLVDTGNLVGESEATLLATITDSNPMYVYFSINERDLLVARAAYRATAIDAGVSNEAEMRETVSVEMSTADQTDFVYEGSLDFAESALNPETGTLQLRASFENPGPIPALISGLFARLRVAATERPDMPLVTERAIGLDQTGRYLYVLGAENVIEKRSVKIGQLIDGMRVIEEGLANDERVVVVGLQRVRGGSTVTPEEADMADFTATALTAARQQLSQGAGPDRASETATQ